MSQNNKLYNDVATYNPGSKLNHHKILTITRLLVGLETYLILGIHQIVFIVLFSANKPKKSDIKKLVSKLIYFIKTNYENIVMNVVLSLVNNWIIQNANKIMNRIYFLDILH